MKRNNWFYRLLFSYLPILLFVVSGLIITCFLFIVKLSEEEAGRANAMFVQTVMQSVDQSLQTIDSVIMQGIQTDELFSAFFNEKGSANTYFLNYEMGQKLRGWMDSNPWISSIYVVRWSDRLLLAQDGLANLDGFLDEAFIKEAQNSMNPLNWIGRQDPFKPHDPSQKVVTLVRKVPLEHGSKGVVVVNIRPRAIARSIEEKTALTLGFIAINGQGDMLLDTSNRSKENAERNHLQLASVTSPYTGWIYESGIKQGSIISYASAFSYLWIILGSLVTIVGVIWVVYATRRNYKPIESIITRIRMNAPVKKDEFADVRHMDEFGFIESMFGNMAEELGKFREQSVKDDIIKRKHVFQKIMSEDVTGEVEQLLSELKDGDLLIQSKQFQFSIAEIDRFHQFDQQYTASDQYLLRYAVTKAIQEIAEYYPFGIYCEWMSPTRLILLFSLGESDSCNMSETANGFWREVIDWMERFMTFSITVGIGREVFYIRDLNRSYRDADEILRYKWLLEDRKVISREDVEGKTGKVYYEYQHLVHALADSFRVGDGKWETLFERLFSEVKGAILTSEDMVNLLNYLLFELDRELSYLDMGPIESLKENSLSHIREEIYIIESVTATQENLKSILMTLFNDIQALRENHSNHEMIQDIKSYIEINYHDSNLSLTSISEKFGLSGNYLSRLFKEEFGESFVSYLIHFRMEKAKQYLKATTEPIQQIANLVGYTHSVSFNRVFKKLAGKTPGEYRSMNEK
ncbi:AraC family transcriptional regulator [Paenibacillus agaridevorans]|uniref:AraC family transcriptional regulator n=1 Tax=Paenibacillus agaridevorans TaxID=171404 RepID=A0A2R5EZH2_9BACL|nr:helix-turn-helix domain-containing protein [Paenibacillus agaridevorans]GBG11515.1 AraC family transcriptional regulator [Paenibacillus agaridevorans]